ncbi:MAG: exodeoxyribonuclease VII small subunit [Bacilli bacterium]
MKNENFEQMIIELEKTVKELESGNVDLDKAIEKYTFAMKLAKKCDEKLKQAESQINKILTEDGKLEDFNYEN